MSDIKLTIDAAILVPTLEVYKEYFDSKYPCTDEKNDGTDMPIPDKIRFATYEHLLSAYDKAKGLYDHIHKQTFEKASLHF